jgi:hypothetical protein
LTNNTKTKDFTDRVLDLKPSLGKLILLSIPPFNAIWLLAIGKRIQNIQNVPDKRLNIIAIINIYLWSTVWFFPFLDFYLTGDLTSPVPKIFLPIALVIFSVWFLTIGIISYKTIKHEHLISSKHFGIADSLDYLKRFFAFVYYPFFMWELHKKISEYKK